MKAIIVPYADMQKCSWAMEFFPDHSIAALPVCGKPFLAYQLDQCARDGFKQVLVADWAFDQKLAKYLDDGSKWGMEVKYTGCGDDMSEKTLKRLHAGFIGDDEPVFIRENTLAGQCLDSLQNYFSLNFSLLHNPGDCVLPGYSSEKGVFAGMNVVIKPHVEVASPVVLGDNVLLERGVRLEGDVILCEGTVLDKGTRMRNTIVFDGTYVGSSMDIDGKIVTGRRIIDPSINAFVDLDDAGLSSELAEPENAKPVPAALQELEHHRFTMVNDKATEETLAKALASLALDISALNLKKIRGVFLGGGYGRGEGGAPLYNDLDFFVLTNGATRDEKNDINVALKIAALKYETELGVSVDFCLPMNQREFKKNEKRLMYQELIRGFVPIYGSAESLDFLRKMDATALPAYEALRLLVNRGMGLLFALTNEDEDFVKRNINKAVLGAGDAMLIVDGLYDWHVETRSRFLRMRLYDQALEFKANPRDNKTATWEEAVELWMKSLKHVMKKEGLGLRHRKIYHAVRWLVRRRVFGDLRTFGCDPLYRILVPLKELLKKGHVKTPVPPELLKDWEIFN